MSFAKVPVIFRAAARLSEYLSSSMPASLNAYSVRLELQMASGRIITNTATKPKRVFMRNRPQPVISGTWDLCVVLRSGRKKEAISPGIRRNTVIRLQSMPLESTRPRS